ncbi:Hsp33 family molecular chaperone HslO [Marinospirillum sp.]|uniref:Hsp33 family molecular chaperone HslO n=1 Tax=Marinospirillum sp. TaxID=2183934 RepID=UPI00286FD4EF|nr:Hsp33 family molecular chaperone HslO [Marinospirillum sp.]MDR9468143.1 Hsp33 family molecular chaperone HslO [Marinospirillum sp.]
MTATQDTPETDQVQRFLFDHTAVRGELAHLQQSYAEVLDRHDYPPAVEEQLGQLLAAAALLTATVKLDGTLSLEVRSQGEVTLMMAECNTGAQGGDQLRGIARFSREPQGSNLQELTQGGQLVITLDPTQGKRYQGIVSLDKENLALCLEGYFANSEQLPTRIWLEAANRKAAGLLLQQLPDDASNTDPDAWNRLTQLAATVQQQELLDLEPLTLLHRLYHEETLRVFPPHNLKFGCTCSRERTSEAIASLGEAELQAIIEEQGKIETQCHFCNTVYTFHKQDLPELLGKPGANQLPEGHKLH